jgi:hypothetical protein
VGESEPKPIFGAFVPASRKRGRGHGASAASLPSSGVADGFAIPPKCASPEMVTDMFYELMDRCGFRREACRRAHLTPYGLRHLLPDLTRAAGWSLEDRMELGRWSLGIIKSLVMARHAEGGTTRSALASSAASLATATANLYSRGRAAMDREVALRRRAVAIISTYVGERAWESVVPVQPDAPSFTFLFEPEVE